jgi:hypothetical protein
MNDNKTGTSPMTAKKVWTAPALEVISLNSARNTATKSVLDGFPHKKS